MNNNVLGFALAAATTIAGCSGSTPVRTEYLLRSDASGNTIEAQAPARVGIGRVVVAPYLDQSGLILETETREVQPARYHHWAEPLDNSLLLYLRSETSKALGEPVSIDRAHRMRWEKTVDVLIEELHGTVAGEALLVATFKIFAPGEDNGSAYHFSKRTSLAEEGYPALVDAEAELLKELAGTIANALGN